MTSEHFEIGIASRPAFGFAEGGDAAVVRCDGGAIVLTMIDVLGHGPQAHEVASRMERLLERTEGHDVAATLALLDEALAGSLGAVAGIAGIEGDGGVGRFVGIGNTVARIFGRSERRLVSVDGVLGRRHATPRPVDFTMEVGDVLILHSDGVMSRFAGSEYPQLRGEDAQVAAREVIRRFGRDYDDSACIVVRRLR